MTRRLLVCVPALVLLTLLSRWLSLPGSGAMAFWLPTGLVLWWALRADDGKELVCAVVLSLVVVAITVLLAERNPERAVASAVISGLVGAAAGSLPRRLGRRWRGASTLTGIRGTTVVISSLVLAALVGTVVLMMLTAGRGGTMSPQTAVTEVFNDVAGALVVAGPLLAYSDRDAADAVPLWLILAGFAVTGLLAALIFSVGQELPLAHALLLPLFWTGIRFPVWLASLHASVTALLTLLLVRLVGGAPFGPGISSGALTARVQLFAIIATVLALVIATAMARSRGLMRELAASEAMALQSAREEKQRSLHDSLTGLLNRRGFEAELERAQASGIDAHVLLLDLDNFKDVNDGQGHAVGDALLIKVGNLLRDNVRESDAVSRLGGDEFAILLKSDRCDAGAIVARQIVQGLADEASRASGEESRVTASIGVVSLQEARASGRDAMVLADMLMYDAKSSGRGTFAALAADGSAPRMASDLETRALVERALATDSFELLIQPILDLRKNEVSGGEALIRLRDGGRLVSPAEFLPLAERSGLATKIDEWVVSEGVSYLAALQRLRRDVRLSINVSGPTLTSSSYVAALDAALRRHAADPSGLVLEVTETAAVSDFDGARQFTQHAARSGVRLSLDDFGAGFGSFYYLKHLAFDFIKIDGEFVRGIAGSDLDHSIVRSLVQVARDLHKQTVAEYVVDAAVLEAVRRLGVDYAQGYAIGAPMTFDAFSAMLVRQLGVQREA